MSYVGLHVLLYARISLDMSTSRGCHVLADVRHTLEAHQRSVLCKAVAAMLSCAGLDNRKSHPCNGPCL